CRPVSLPQAQLPPLMGTRVSPRLLGGGGQLGPTSDFLPGTHPKPTIWAEPGSVVPWGSPVTIWCQGPPGALEFHLDKEGISVGWDRQKPLEPRDKAKFSIHYMGQDHAGSYRCYYRTPTGWSECSDPLELVVTGPHGKPSLSALPSPVVTSGGSTVTLLCQSGNRTDTFLLSKEGAAHRPLRLRSWDQDGWYQAEFSLSPVTAAHGGTYRCYHSLSTDPYLLAHTPVLGDGAGADLCALTPDCTVPNLTRMGLAASVLLLLGILLCQARHDCRGARDAAWS
uniref:Ig-like domain-containing protein n=1 Tax=Moschus moschiferus TaxID=68415 RepID=A0A8C6CNS7_MOSMO